MIESVRGRSQCRAVALVAFALLCAPSVTLATAFRTGDIIVATSEGDGFIVPFTYKIRELAPDGALIQEFGDFGLDMRFSSSGILHVAALTEIERFASDGLCLRQ